MFVYSASFPPSPFDNALTLCPAALELQPQRTKFIPAGALFTSLVLFAAWPILPFPGADSPGFTFPGLCSFSPGNFPPPCAGRGGSSWPPARCGLPGLLLAQRGSVVAKARPTQENAGCRLTGRVLSTPGGPGSAIKTLMEPCVPLHPYGVLYSMGNSGIGPRRPTYSFGSRLWSAGVLLPSQAASPPGGAFSRAQLATSGLLFAG